MMLFSKDTEEVSRIADSLVKCGCCARCTLRYLGLKDTYSYKKTIEEMGVVVNSLINVKETDSSADKSPADIDKATDEVNNHCNNDQIERKHTDCSSIREIHQTEHNAVDDTNSLEAKAELGETQTEAKAELGETQTEAKAELGETEAKAELGETHGEAEAKLGETQASVGKPGDDELSHADRLDLKQTNDDSGAEMDLDDGLNETNQLDMGKPDLMEIDKTVNGNNLADSREKDGSVSKELAHKLSPCVICLGILEEFTTDEFLQKIKVASVDDGYEFSNYICSLMVPVCVILREHALMLFLKQEFGNVYKDVKFLDIPTIKDVWKWRNGPELKEILDAPFDQKSNFDIILNFIYKESDRECSFLLNLMSDTFRKRKQDRRTNKKGAFQLYNRANVTKAVLEMSTKEFKSHFQCPPPVPKSRCTCDIKCQNMALFIAGRYNKYSRTLSQTPWIIEGHRKSESSVEELICTEIDKAFRPTEHKFSSAGREDVDVLMLGDGRPFIVELTNPHRVSFTQEEITKIQTLANSATKDIFIRDLQIVSRDYTDKLKEGEIDKIKNYLATCWSKTPVSAAELNKLTEMKDLKILQKTPIRVLHRRPLSTREKCIHNMTVEKIDDYHFRVGLKTQAGTYIKEFVHGDFGRTKPNLTSLLGADCDILELDVQSVELDWPKKLE